MTKADAARLVAIIVTAYPNSDKFKDADSVAATVNLWASMFADDPSGIVGLAVQKHIATSKWPPSIAEIREIIAQLTTPDLIPPDQAWLAVSDLMGTIGRYNHGDLQRQLPPLVARAVEAIGWGNLCEMHSSYCSGGRPGMDRLAFMDQYKPMYEREKERAMLPKAIAEKADAIANAVPDGGRSLLEVREQKLREHNAMRDTLWFAAMTCSERLLQERNG